MFGGRAMIIVEIMELKETSFKCTKCHNNVKDIETIVDEQYYTCSWCGNSGLVVKGKQW